MPHFVVFAGVCAAGSTPPADGHQRLRRQSQSHSWGNSPVSQATKHYAGSNCVTPKWYQVSKLSCLKYNHLENRMKSYVSWLLIFCTLMLASVVPAFAMSDADKAVWGASEKVDTSFIVPTAQGAAVMGRAQGLISQWNGFDRGMSVMKIQTVTENLIETYNPTDIGNVGFNVTRTTLPEGDQISVNTMYLGVTQLKPN